MSYESVIYEPAAATGVSYVIEDFTFKLQTFFNEPVSKDDIIAAQDALNLQFLAACRQDKLPIASYNDFIWTY